MAQNPRYSATGRRPTKTNIARRLPHAFFLTDGERTPDPVAIIHTLPAGTGVIFRHYDDPDRLALGHKVANACRQRGLCFLVAGDVDLARILNADGIHLPEWMLARSRHIFRGNGALVTAAAHSLASVRRAGLARVDAVLVSPVFATTSHPGASVLGPHRLARIAAAARMPVYALGGIEPTTMRRLPPNIEGFAAIGLFQKGRAAVTRA